MKTALLFPGQGSQVVEMGKDFYENFKESKLIFEEASDTIHLNLKALCFDGPQDTLTLTENLQPALFVTEAAMLAAINAHQEIDLTITAGHSLGEYSALHAAGSLSLSDGVGLCRLRGAAMQRAVPVGHGTMAAVLGLDEAAVDSLCNKARDISHEVVEPANYNSPGQIVIAGSIDGVEAALSLLKTDEEFRSGRATPLKVSAPFHCSLMEPARKELAPKLAATPFSRPSCKIVPNVTASVCDRETDFAGLLTAQIVRPVRWYQSMQTLKDLGVERAIEVGPGRVLAGLMKRIDRALPTFNISSVDQLKDVLR